MRILMVFCLTTFGCVFPQGNGNPQPGPEPYNPPSGNGCQTDADCGDGVDCTDDVCGADGWCYSTPNDGLCWAGRTCDPYQGCINGQDSGGHGCQTDADCGDGIACTIEQCQNDGTCVTVAYDDASCGSGRICDPTSGCVKGRVGNAPNGYCHSDSDCGDGVSCTLDYCLDDGTCLYYYEDSYCASGQTCDPYHGCTGGGSGSCSTNCDDGVYCTVDSCSNGSCTHTPDNSRCGANQYCSASQGCVNNGTPSGSHTINCSNSGGTLTVTVTGTIQDALVNGSLTSPGWLEVASDTYGWTPIPYSSSTTGHPMVGWTWDGATYAIQLPSNTTGFSLYLANTSYSDGRWFDAGKWTPTGSCSYSGTKLTNNGATGGSCSNGCDDGVYCTYDHCDNGTCVHEPQNSRCGTNQYCDPVRDCVSNGAPGGHTVNCAWSGSSLVVTVNGTILNTLSGGSVINPGWIEYGSDTDGWSVPYSSGKPKAAWNYDGATYSLTLDGSVNNFNLYLANASYSDGKWFDSAQWTATGICWWSNNKLVHAASTGGTCASGCDDGIYCTVDGCSGGSCYHTPDNSRCPAGQYCNPTQGCLANGSGSERVISCSVSGPDMTVTISGSVTDALVGGTVTYPGFIEYGSDTDGWSLPYSSGKPKATWVNNSTTYTLVLSASVQNFNFYLTDSGVSWGRYFDSTKWTATGACRWQYTAAGYLLVH